MQEDWRAVCLRTAKNLAGLCEIDASVFDCAQGYCAQAPQSGFCTACTHPACHAARVCEYGLREAYRWQGHYIYYCPAGLTFVAACAANAQGALAGGVTLGPMLMGECFDALYTLDLPDTSFKAIRLPDFSTERVTALAHVLQACLCAEQGADSNRPDRYEGYSPDLHSAQSSDIAYKVMEYLCRNYAAKLTLDDIAAEVYLSRAYVSTLFKQQTGEGIFECLTRLRVEKSKAMLRGANASLCEVALACGFEDQSYFTKVFKKSAGCSPGQFRRQRG